MNTKIKNLGNFFIEECKKYNDLICCRDRKLNFKHVLYFLIKIIKFGGSYTSATNSLSTKNIVDVSKQAFRKKRNLIGKSIFAELNMNLYNHIYNSGLIEHKNIYGIDGSKITLNKSFANQGFQLTQTKSYCKATVSCIYDVCNKMPLGFYMDNTSNERKLFLDHLSVNIPPNSVLLFDRGYQSSDFMLELHNKNLKYIIRLPKSLNEVKYMEKHELTTSFGLLTNKKITMVVKYIKYEINKKNYYLATNIFNHDIDYYKTNYNMRWPIEEYFKTCKNNLNMNTIGSKELNKVQQELNGQSIMALLSRYLEKIGSTYISKNKNENITIDHKNSIKITRKILFIILFNGNKIKKIINNLQIIISTKVSNKKNRNFKRIRKRPVSQFYLDKRSSNG